MSSRISPPRLVRSERRIGEERDPGAHGLGPGDVEVGERLLEVLHLHDLSLRAHGADGRLVHERCQVRADLPPSRQAAIFVSLTRISAVSSPIRTHESASCSHGPWLSSTRSIVLVRHLFNHSQTPTEFPTEFSSERRRRRARAWRPRPPRGRPPARASPDVSTDRCAFANRHRNSRGLYVSFYSLRFGNDLETHIKRGRARSP